MIGPMDICVDLFAGGGGVSCGFEMAMGFSPDIAVNHSPEAIAMHMANHPDTKHYQTDVWEVDPVEVCAGRPVGMLWASPDCTHFSKAKGGRPRSRKIRSLAWVVVRWAKEVRPKVIMLENVEEFKTRGPIGADGQPIKALAGETFTHFIDALRELGYQVEYRELRACDYGAPTIRKRLFLIARCDGDTIVWPEKTHGPGTGNPYRTAAECIDWSIPCPSIFGRRIPLKPNTLRRIAKGVLRYIVNNPKPFVVRTGAEVLIKQNFCSKPCQDVEEPLHTITTQHNKFALVTAFLSQYHGEQSEREVRGQALSEPIMVVDSSNRYGLCAVSLMKNYSGVVGQKVDVPTGTVTAVDHHSLVACSLVRQFGTSNAADIESPLGTVMPHGNGKTGLVAAFLDKYYGTGGGALLNEPMPTATSKDRLSLVTVNIDGECYAVSDIGMRMLQPRELYRAQGFPEDYVIAPEYMGKSLSKSAQVRLCGNSVCPPMAAALIGANLRAKASAGVA
ncbi:MAG: DNA cytosine methyltransferase [Synergistes sp.]|nr:DNA cytosine methyltransferase [Synergistes sp.]